VTRARVLSSIALSLGVLPVAACSSEPECAAVATEVIERTGWPPAAARWARSVPADEAWAFGVPADTTSIEPEVAVYVTDRDPSLGGEGSLVPVEESALEVSGPLDSEGAPPILLDLVGDADVIAGTRECVHRGVQGTSQ